MNFRWKVLLITFLLIVILTWVPVFSFNSNLKIIACDVGQGDAYLVQKGTVQVLIDGGPSSKVATCLSKYVPFWDRKIEMVIMTHPQTDHFVGLVEVFKTYGVGLFLTSGLGATSSEFLALEGSLSNSTQVLFVVSGDHLRVGDLYFDIIWPEENFVVQSTRQDASTRSVLGMFTSAKDPNDFSIVTALHYEDFDALFTGDIGPQVSGRVVSNLKGSLKYEYLKVPHHGSKNGLTKDFLEEVSPKIAVISSGKDNSYGHPHRQILDMLAELDVHVSRTDIEGDVVLETNGTTWWIQ